MNPASKHSGFFSTRSTPRLAAVISLVFWITAWVLIHERFSTEDFCDLYQNSAPYAGQHYPLDLRFPMLGDFPPFTEAWGTQWPFFMAIKSIIFFVIPYNFTSIFMLGMTICAIGAGFTFHVVRQLSANLWLAFLAAAVVLSDRHLLLIHVMSGRAEPLVCVLLLLLLDQSRRIVEKSDRTLRPGYLIPFVLLPGLHPFGLMIGGGLVMLHLVFFRRLFTNGTRWLCWGPLLGYLVGMSLLALWFGLQPAAWEQMKLNMEVQQTIYQTATRYTFFRPFISGYPLFTGYLLWGGGLLASLFVAGLALQGISRDTGFGEVRVDQLFSAAIVVALPVIGFIVRLDNYFYYVVGLSAVVYLWVSLCNSVVLSQKHAVTAVMVIFAWVTLASFALPVWRLVQFTRADFPNLRLERKELVERYMQARRLYISPHLFPEAMALAPEKSRFYTFPLPMLKNVRKAYEDSAYADVQAGDVMIIPTHEHPSLSRLLRRPVGAYHPPDPNQWDFVKRHVRLFPGSIQWGWDLSVYRHR